MLISYGGFRSSTDAAERVYDFRFMISDLRIWIGNFSGTEDSAAAQLTTRGSAYVRPEGVRMYDQRECVCSVAISRCEASSCCGASYLLHCGEANARFELA